MIIGLVCTLVVLAAFSALFKEIVREKTAAPERQFNGPVPPPVDPGDMVVDGKRWPIQRAEMAAMLQKRCPYYQQLDAPLQQRFLRRVHRFLQTKIFIIKSESGVREMPVLSAAAAVQLTFGLNDYLLPWFRYIQLFPEEFCRGKDLRILAGNVSSRTISMAWNHLLKGNECADDGCNVALHEMSHALYYQKMEVEGLDAYRFGDAYEQLLLHCRKAYGQELRGRYDLYSHYATGNLQEFWAESVELFFEKPAALQQTYPDVFRQLSCLLNQDPQNKARPVVARHFFRLFS